MSLWKLCAIFYFQEDKLQCGRRTTAASLEHDFESLKCGAVGVRVSIGQRDGAFDMRGTP